MKPFTHPSIRTARKKIVNVLTTDTPSEKSSQWINGDLCPTPEAARTWTWYANILINSMSVSLMRMLETGYH